MKYRSEIDGLRALAVLPVIFFHAEFSVFSGGFIGVDIFFVISGFLITNILIESIEKDNFSLVGFYARRVRRILPALLVLILLCIPLAWLLMLPHQMHDFSKSVIATNLISSNVLFWLESGYFSVASEQKPLLHTWSLAVEEQFYMFFPIFLIFVWRLGTSRIFIIILFLALLSLMISEWGWRYKSIANFYLTPSRAWELLLGSAAAFIACKTSVASVSLKTRNILSVIGLLSVFIAVFLYNDTTPAPSLYILVPVIGASLILVYCNKETLIGKILSFKPLVSIGLISYSAYLYHHPLFAFARIHYDGHVDKIIFITLIFLTFFFAYVSWSCIERPFRNKKIISTRTLTIFITIGTIFTLTFGAAGVISDGFILRYQHSQEYQNILSKIEGNYGLSKKCEKVFVSEQPCKTSEDPKILVWGDSYAMHIVPAIMSDNPAAKIQQATFSQCAPILGYSLPGIEHGAQNCINFNNQVYNYLVNHKSITHVLFSSPFVRLIDNKPLINKDGFIDSSGKEVTEREFVDLVGKINELGRHVIVVTPPPTNGHDLGECLVDNSLRGMNLKTCDFAEDEIIDRVTAAEKFLQSLDKVNVIKLRDYICEQKICRASQNGLFLYRDTGHLSVEGSEYLGQKINIYKKIINKK